MPKEPPYEVRLMTSPRISRRMASPVRVSLSVNRGGDIDGAWWPRSAAMARELPDLVEALRPTLGDIVDISINWSANSPTPVLSTMSPDIAAKIEVAIRANSGLIAEKILAGEEGDEDDAAEAPKEEPKPADTNALHAISLNTSTLSIWCYNCDKDLISDVTSTDDTEVSMSKFVESV